MAQASGNRKGAHGVSEPRFIRWSASGRVLISSLFFGFKKKSSLMILFSGKTTWEISAKNPTLPGTRKKGGAGLVSNPGTFS